MGFAIINESIIFGSEYQFLQFVELLRWCDKEHKNTKMNDCGVYDYKVASGNDMLQDLAQNGTIEMSTMLKLMKYIDDPTIKVDISEFKSELPTT